jgi:hypothetical protein
MITHLLPRAVALFFYFLKKYILLMPCNSKQSGTFTCIFSLRCSPITKIFFFDCLFRLAPLMIARCADAHQQLTGPTRQWIYAYSLLTGPTTQWIYAHSLLTGPTTQWIYAYSLLTGPTTQWIYAYSLLTGPITQWIYAYSLLTGPTMQWIYAQSLFDRSKTVALS